MKISLILISCFLQFLILGQISEQSAIEEGTNMVVGRGQIYQEVFYGFPNFFKDFNNGVNQVDDFGNTNVVRSSGYGPIGTRIEYMITNDFSIGIETATVVGENERLYLSPEGDTIDRFYRKRTKIGVLPLFTFHFSEISKFDMYWCVGIGYKYFKYESEGEEFWQDINRISLPISWRIAGGFRFFPIPKLGIGMNVGIGQGGVINFGAVYRFI